VQKQETSIHLSLEHGNYNSLFLFLKVSERVANLDKIAYLKKQKKFEMVRLFFHLMVVE